MSIARHNTRIFYWTTLLGSIDFLEPVLTMFYLHRGLTPVQIFFSLTAFSSANLVAEVPTGAFADRYGPKAAFLTGCAVKTFAMALLLMTDSTWAIFASNFLWGVGWSFFSGADEALLYESLKEEGQESRMGEVLGRIASAGFLPMVAAYLAGPLLARNLTEGQFMLLIALNTVCQAGTLLLMVGVRNPASFEHYRENPWTHIRNAVGVIRSNPNLFLLFVNATLVFIPTYVFQRWDQPYMTGAGVPVTLMGVLYAAGAVLSWGLSRYLGSLTLLAPRLKVIMWSGLTILLALVAAAFVQNSLIVAGFAFFLVRAGRTIRNPILGQMQNEYIPSGSRATTLSILSVMDSVADVVVVPLMATLAGFGLSAIFAVSAGVVGLGMLVPVREPVAAAATASARGD